MVGSTRYFAGMGWAGGQGLALAIPDVTAPTVVSFSPADNATGVSLSTNLVATMSEFVLLGASGVISLKKTSDNSVIQTWNVATNAGTGAGQVSVVGGNALTMRLTSSLPNSAIEYYVIWDAGVVKDTSNNNVAALSVTTTWSYTTGVFDLTAPVLSSPTDTSTGTTTATLTVSTNEANGTLYVVVTTSATPPSAAQVKAGLNNAGTAAAYSSSQGVSSTGVKTFSATSLTASTAYFTYFMHEDASANQSSVSAADGFTTSAGGGDTTAPILTNPTDAGASASTATLTVDTDEGNGTLYVVVSTSSTTPSKAQVKAGQSASGSAATYAGNQAVVSTGTKSFTATGLATATQYYTFFMHEDAAANQSNVSAADGLSTYLAGRDIVMGVTPPATGSGAGGGNTYIIGGRPVWEDGTLTKVRIYAGASATIKIKIFRRSGVTFTMQSEQSVSVVSGLNTLTVGSGLSSAVAVSAGDFFALYSTTGNWIHYNTPTISGTEYYAPAGDVTTTTAVAVAALPSQGIQLQVEFTVSVPAKPGYAAVGSVIYLGEPSPATGTGTADTASSYFDEKPWVVPARLETLQVYTSGACYLICYVLTPTATAYSYRAFAVNLVSGNNNLVAGTDFPNDVVMPVGGVFGFWSPMSALKLDANTTRQYRILDATLTDGLFPLTATAIFAPNVSGAAPQVKAGWRPTQAKALSTTLLDYTFSTSIAPWFIATNWSISGGKAVPSSTGLLNSILYRCISTYDSTVTAYVTPAGATDKFALVRSPTGQVSSTGFGTVGTVDLSTNKIAILSSWDGTSTVPAVKTEKVVSFTPFVVGRSYKVDLIRLGDNITLTVTDTTNSNTDSITFQCWTGAGGTTVDYTAGRCFGLPGFAALVGTPAVTRMLFTVPVAQPIVVQVGDSGTDGSGATSQANAVCGLVKTGVSGAAVIAGVGGAGHSYIEACMEYMVRQFLPAYAVLQIGGNDTGAYSAWQADMARITEYIGMLSGTTSLYIGTVLPQAGSNVPEVSMNPYLRANYAGKIIDFDYAVTTGRTGLGANLNGGYFYDTLHVNNTGAAAMYAEEQADVPFV